MNWLKDIFLVASFRHDTSMSSSACHVLPRRQCRQRCRWPEPTRRRSPKGPLKWSADLSTALRRRIWFTPKSSKIKHGNGQIPCFFLINVPWKPPNYGIFQPRSCCQSAWWLTYPSEKWWFVSEWKSVGICKIPNFSWKVIVQPCSTTKQQ